MPLSEAAPHLVTRRVSAVWGRVPAFVRDMMVPVVSEVVAAHQVRLRQWAAEHAGTERAQVEFGRVWEDPELVAQRRLADRLAGQLSAGEAERLRAELGITGGRSEIWRGELNQLAPERLSPAWREAARVMLNLPDFRDVLPEVVAGQAVDYVAAAAAQSLPGPDARPEPGSDLAVLVSALRNRFTSAFGRQEGPASWPEWDREVAAAREVLAGLDQDFGIPELLEARERAQGQLDEVLGAHRGDVVATEHGRSLYRDLVELITADDWHKEPEEQPAGETVVERVRGRFAALWEARTGEAFDVPAAQAYARVADVATGLPVAGSRPESVVSPVVETPAPAGTSAGEGHAFGGGREFVGTEDEWLGHQRRAAALFGRAQADELAGQLMTTVRLTERAPRGWLEHAAERPRPEAATARHLDIVRRAVAGAVAGFETHWGEDFRRAADSSMRAQLVVAMARDLDMVRRADPAGPG